MKQHIIKNIQYIILLLIALSFSIKSNAQDWALSVKNIKQSTCAHNGSFTIEITGGDKGNLQSVLYGIAAPGVNDYVVTPNTSPDFISAPKGTHTVLVEAFFNGERVFKTIDVTVPGTYTFPEFTAKLSRNSLNCETTTGYGRITISGIAGSSRPYIIKIVEAPPAYSGLTSFSTSNASLVLNDLVSGTYKIQLTDNCGYGTSTQNITVKSLNINDAIPALLQQGTIFRSVLNEDCMHYSVNPPYINANQNTNPDWNGYNSYDTPIEWAVSFIGYDSDKSEYKKLYNGGYAEVKLPGGKKLKDYYNVTTSFLKVFIKPPCGTEISFELPTNLMYSFYAYGPYVVSYTSSICNTGFALNYNFSTSTAIVCYPVKAKITNNPSYPATPSYSKEFTISGPGNHTLDTLPFGYYTVEFKTSDGGVFTRNISKASPASYTYTLTRYAYSLHNRLDNVRFYRGGEYFTKGTKYALLDTLSGKGFAWEAEVTNETSSYLYCYGAANNTSENYYIRPGKYIFRITDKCGTYDYEVEVKNENTYYYTIDVSDTGYNCEGMYVVPKGTTTYNGNANLDTYFRVYSGPTGYPTKIYKEGDTILLKKPGTYKIKALGSSISANTYGNYDYNLAMATVECTLPIIEMNGAVSQGFVCINAGDTDGQVSIRGTGGEAPYHYYLYPTEQDVINSTNVMADNNTGEFNNMNLMRNSIYWLKIVDACGRHSNNIAVKILDLSTAQLIASNKPSYCEGDDISLHAIALPNPTYSWTGPNGFSSLEQSPTIHNASSANSGVYQVTISTASCGLPTTSSLTVNVYEKAQASEVLIPSVVTVLNGTKAQLTPSAASNIQTPSFSWYKSQTSLAPIYTHIAGGYFETPPLTKDTTFYVTVSGSNKCENTVSNRKQVYVQVLNIPEMILTDICSTNPYITLINTYTDNNYTWEYSTDGTGSWQPELTNTTETRLNVNKEGFYRLSVNHNGMPAYNVSQGIQVIINRKIILPGGVLWYDMSYNLVTINW